MNACQVMCVIACCTLMFAGVVGFITMQGVPLIIAFLSVYAVAVLSMVGMQRRARQSSEGSAADRRHVAGTDADDDSGADLEAESTERRSRHHEPADCPGNYRPPERFVSDSRELGVASRSPVM